MATQPKPKPKPEPEPKPDEDEAAAVDPEPAEGQPPVASVFDRLDALFTSHVKLTERVEKLEERVAAPPVGIGRRP
jgi:hypothetical protein